MKLIVGVDESYDSVKNGIFIMCFFIVKENDYANLNSNLNQIKQERNIKEFKNNKINLKFKQQIFNFLHEITFNTFVYEAKINDVRKILDEYKTGIKSFANFICQKNTDNNLNLNLEIELDNMGSQAFQFECVKILRNIFKKNKITQSIRFLKSEKSNIIQVADLFAGENRRGLKNKSNISKNLLQNKNSIF